MVGLKVYKVKDKESYEKLRSILSGLAFFRHTETEFFVKTPFNDIVKMFLDDKLMGEVI
jgi:hypothetical protein